MDAAALGIGGAKTIGVRPEHLTLSTDAGQWQGKVVHTEHLGADTNVYLETAKTGMITARLFGEVNYAQDTMLWASAEPKFIYRFDDAGRAIR
jgi:multiple sugar transport system ATP-binding protein